LRAAIEKSADEFGALWKFRFAVPCRRKAAKDITPQDIADSNLILIGTPDQNPLMAQVVRKLPISFEPDDSVHLGAKLYTGPNLGLALCYPNPLNPNRYVVLIAGTTPAAYADIHVRFGNWFDWIPYDFRKHYDFAIFDDQTNGHNPETFLVWGFFDEQWQLAPDLTFEGIPAWRSKSRPRVMPDVLWNKQQPPWPGTLHLDRVAARNVTVNKEYLERNRTLQGGPLQLRGEDFERGLCCRFPCSLTFDCAGYKRLKLLASVQWDGKTEPSDDRKTFEKVRVTVHADGKQIFEALEQTYKDAPCEIDVELKGAKTITLSANGGLPWLNGSFIFANARLEGREDVDSPQRHRDTEKERK
jgi:hypothetical protein